MEKDFKASVGITFARKSDGAKFKVEDLRDGVLFARQKQTCFRIVRDSGSESWAPCEQFLAEHEPLAPAAEQ